MSTNDYTAYLAHFGTKGQKWGLRKQQSYQVAPTRSGMVGQEVGEAAKQANRLGSPRDKAEQAINKKYNEIEDKYISFRTKHKNAKIDDLDDDVNIDDPEIQKKYGFSKEAAKDWREMKKDVQKLANEVRKETEDFKNKYGNLNLTNKAYGQTLTVYGKPNKNIMRAYDHRESSAYKKGLTSDQKRLVDDEYFNNVRQYGQKTANELYYKTFELGQDYSSLKQKTNKQLLTAVAGSIGVGTGIGLATALTVSMKDLKKK